MEGGTSGQREKGKVGDESRSERCERHHGDIEQVGHTEWGRGKGHIVKHRLIKAG